MPLENFEQKYSRYAWECVNQAKNTQGIDFKEYVSLVKNLPANIMTNGLGQTLAFLTSKAKLKNGRVDSTKPHGKLYLQLETWLIEKEDTYRVKAPDEKDNEPMKLLCRIIYSDSLTYQRATEQALKLAEWLKPLSSSFS